MNTHRLKSIGAATVLMAAVGIARWEAGRSAGGDRGARRSEPEPKSPAAVPKLHDLTNAPYVPPAPMKAPPADAESAAHALVPPPDAVAAGTDEEREATILGLAEVQTGPDWKREKSTVPAGTLLRIVGEPPGRSAYVEGGLASVRLPDGSTWKIARCLLSNDAAEVAVARALASTAEARAEARRAFASAALAPMLDGKPPILPSCPPIPADRNVYVEGHDGGPSRSGHGFERLGIWHPSFIRVDPPSIHNWRALADAYSGIHDGAPLPGARRDELTRAFIRKQMAEGEESMSFGPPTLEFDAPTTDVRGVYYAFTPTRPVLATGVRLVGQIYPVIDCAGCERGPRAYAGQVALSFPDSREPAYVLWRSEPVRFSEPEPLNSEAWTAQENGSFDVRLPSLAGGEARRYTGHANHGWSRYEGFAVKRAYLTGIPGLGLRLLVTETSGNPACGRGLYVFNVTKDALELLGGNDFECDV